MTISIQSGPSWVSLSNDSRLVGTPTAVGSYQVVLASAVGIYSATTTVTIIVSQLAPVYFDVVSQLLAIGSVALSFQAYIGLQEPTMFPLTLTFKAVQVTVILLGTLSMSFSAAAPAGPVIPTPGSPDFNEPNNNTATATVLTSGVASYNTMPTGDVFDNFSIVKGSIGPITLQIANFTQATGDWLGLYIDINRVSSPGDPFLSNPVYSRSWYQEAPVTAVVNGTYVTSSLPAGDYVITINRTEDAIQSYTLTASWDTALADANEPNYSPRLATTLSNNVASTGNKLLTSDVDWFKFAINSPLGIAFSFTNMTPTAGTTGYMKVNLWTRPLGSTSLPTEINSGTSQWYVNSLADTTMYFPGRMAAAEYFIRVGQSSVQYTSYSLVTNTFVTGVPDSSEPNNLLSTANVLSNDIATDLRSITQAGNDVDWFKFTLTSTAIVTLSMTEVVVPGYSQYPSISFELYDSTSTDSSFTPVQSFYVAGFATSLTQTTASLIAGDYWVRVSSICDAYKLKATW